jgi:DNA polymerase III epsilon subunit-like protein
MGMPKIFAVDFEGTTRDGVWEFGFVQIEQSAVVNPLTEICAVHQGASFFLEKSRRSTRPTGDAKPFQGYFPLFKSLRKRGIFAAHRAQVELSLLRNAWPSPGFVPNFFEGTIPSHGLTWGPCIDTFVLCRRYFPQFKTHTLRDAVESFALGDELRALARKMCPPGRCAFHCALFDAIGCALVLRHLLAAIPLTLRQAVGHSLSRDRIQEQQQGNLF